MSLVKRIESDGTCPVFTSFTVIITSPIMTDNLINDLINIPCYNTLL